MKINLVAASRERPTNLVEVLTKFIKESSNPTNLSIIISIDETDPTKDHYVKLLNDLTSYTDVVIKLIINDNTNTVQAINRCKSHIDGDLIFIISDDTDCFTGWDKKIISCIGEGNTVFIIKTSDCIGTDLITMPIFSSEYLKRKSWIYYPEYEHMFCDTDLTCVAHLEGYLIHAHNIIFNHLHYTQGHRDKDHIDNKNQNTFYSGMEIFKKRLEENFGISKDNQIGNIPNEILDYIKLYN